MGKSRQELMDLIGEKQVSETSETQRFRRFFSDRCASV
jgi:hypothetical protein